MRHNKQHDARAASFKRIAKGLRAQARDCRATGAKHMALMFTGVAKEHEAEATRLRAMR